MSHRSTAFPRTIETLQQVIHGLYPSDKFLNGSIPRVRVRHPADENLMGNAHACGKLKELMLGFERGSCCIPHWNPSTNLMITYSYSCREGA